MTSANIKTIALKGISLFVAIAFTVTTLTGNPSQALALPEIFNSLDGLRPPTELRKDLYAMPAELGSLVSLWEPSAGNSPHGFVVQIQDAHANPEGQKNVAGMLKYLEAKIPGLVIGLEGADGALHPEYLNLMRGFPEANRAVIEDLRQKGELNGAELFLLEKHQKGSQITGRRPPSKNIEESVPVSSVQSSVFGVENAGLYYDNLQTYRELLSHRDEIRILLGPIRAQLETEASKKLSGELRDFLKERSRRKEGRFDPSTASGNLDLQAYTRYLEKQVSKVLEIDLKDSIEQLRFPNLLRVVQISEAQKGFDLEKVKAQWAETIRGVRAAAGNPDEKKFAGVLTAFGQERGYLAGEEGPAFASSLDPALYPRKLLEGLFRFAQKHPLAFAGREAFWQSWKLAVFQAEIDVTELLAEMNMLEEELIRKLVRTEEEKALVQKMGNFDLFEKMLRLELSREEYNKILENDDVLRSFSSESKPLDAFLARAQHFYAVSLKRDEALVTNLLSLLPKSGEKTSVRVLYSGGFHTPGVRGLLRRKNIGYAVFSPRITNTDHGEMYQKVMSGENADLSAYFKVKNPFSSRQEAIFFKEILEVAAPALFKAYKMKPAEIASLMKQAVSDHPVLSKAVTASVSRDTAETVVHFQTRADSRELSSDRAAVMAAALLGSAYPADSRESQTLKTEATDVRVSQIPALRLEATPGKVIPSITQTATLGDNAQAVLGSSADRTPEPASVPVSMTEGNRSEVRRNNARVNVETSIRAIREHLGMTVREFGIALDPAKPILHGTLTNWESGRNPVPDGIMKRAARLVAEKAGPRLKMLRENVGMTIQEFGVALDPAKPILPGTLSNWESGRNPVPDGIMKRAARLVAEKAGPRLKMMREHLGMTAQEFGIALDPEQPILHWTLSSWENRVSPVPDGIMEKAAILVAEKAGPRLKMMREHLGMTAQEFGAVLDPEQPILQGTLSNLESGRNPVPDWIMKRTEMLVAEKAGPRLKMMREHLGMTAQAFGIALDPVKPILPGTLSNWEGRMNPVPYGIMKRAEMLVAEKAGLRLKMMRKHLGMTAQELGIALNPAKPILQGTLAGWERGRTPVPGEVMKEVEKLVEKLLSRSVKQLANLNVLATGGIAVLIRKLRATLGRFEMKEASETTELPKVDLSKEMLDSLSAYRLWPVTNEQDWVEGIEAVEGKEGVLIGVGTGGPVFSYLVHGHFDRAVIVDKNPYVTEVIVPVMLEMIKSSKNRAEFLSLHSGFPLSGAEIDQLAGASIHDIHQRLIAHILPLRISREDAKLDAKSLEIWERFSRQLPAEWQPWARAYWDKYHASFFKLGLLVKMMSQTDKAGRGSWLASEENFQKFGQMVRTGKITTMTGGLEDPTLAQKMADQIRGGEGTVSSKVSAVYTSNVTELVEPLVWERILENLKTLPVTKDTVVLVSHMNTGEGLRAELLEALTKPGRSEGGRVRSEARDFRAGKSAGILAEGSEATPAARSEMRVAGPKKREEIAGKIKVGRPVIGTILPMATQRGESFVWKGIPPVEMPASRKEAEDFIRDLTERYRGGEAIARISDEAPKKILDRDGNPSLLNWIFPPLEAEVFKQAVLKLAEAQQQEVPSDVHPLSRLLALVEQNAEVLTAGVQKAYDDQNQALKIQDPEDNPARAAAAVGELTALISDYIRILYVSKALTPGMSTETIKNAMRERAHRRISETEQSLKELNVTLAFVEIMKRDRDSYQKEKQANEEMLPLLEKLLSGGIAEEERVKMIARVIALEAEEKLSARAQRDLRNDFEPAAEPLQPLLGSEVERAKKARVNIRVAEALASPEGIRKFIRKIKAEQSVIPGAIKSCEAYLAEYGDASGQSGSLSAKQDMYRQGERGLSKYETETNARSPLWSFYEECHLRLMRTRFRAVEGAKRGDLSFNNWTDSAKTVQVFVQEVLQSLGVFPVQSMKVKAKAGEKYILVVAPGASDTQISEQLSQIEAQGGEVIGITGEGVFSTHWVVLMRSRANPPPILLMSGTRVLELMRREGTSAMILPKTDDSGLLVLNPAKEDFAEEERRAEGYRLLQQALVRMRGLPPSLKIATNIVPGPAVLTGEVGLVRSDVISEDMGNAMQKLAVGISDESIKPREWLESLKTKRSEARGSQEEGPNEGPTAENVRAILRERAADYKQVLKQGALAGTEVPLRTLDLQRDSKNKAVLEMIEEIVRQHPSTLQRDPGKPIMGFDFYKNSALGELQLVIELAAMIMSYHQSMQDLSPERRSRLVPLFPMVASYAQFRWIKDELWPLAQELALSEMTAGAGEPAEKISSDIKKIGHETKFGIMVELVSLLRSGDMESFLKDPAISRFNIGTNDLLTDYLRMHNLNASRESPAGDDFMKRLYPDLMADLESLIRRAQAWGKTVCFCGGIAEVDKFLLQVEWWRRHLGIQDLKAANSPVSLSVSGDAVAHVNHVLQIFRGIPEEEFELVFGPDADPAMLDVMAREFANRYVSVSELVSVLVEEWQERFEAEGFHQALYRLGLDPEHDLGGNVDFTFLKKLMRTWLANSADDLNKLQLLPGEEVTREEVERILNYLADRKMMIRLKIPKILEAFDFMRSVYKVHAKLRAEDPGKFSGDLYPAIMGEFVEEWAKTWAEQHGGIRPDWLPQGDFAVELFYEKYHENMSHSFYTVSRTLHEIDANLIHPIYPQEDPIREFTILDPTTGQPLKKRIKLQMRHGLTMSRERGRKGEVAWYLHVEDALESFRQHPEMIDEVYLLAAEKGVYVSHRIQWAIEELELERELSAARKGRNAAPEVGDMDFWQKLLSMDHSIMYAVWRIHESGRFERLFPYFEHLRRHTLKESGSFSLQMQTLRTLETLEEIHTKETGFAYRGASRVFREIRATEEGALLTRLAVLLHPIVETEIPEGRFSTATVRELTERLLTRLNIAPGPIREKLVWLLFQQHRFARQGFRSREDIEKEVVEVVKTPSVSPELLKILYVVIFAKKAADADPESKIMLPRQGSTSPLADLDRCFLAGMSMLASRTSPEGPFTITVQKAVDDADREVARGRNAEVELRSQLAHFVATGDWASILKDYLANTQGGEDPQLELLLRGLIADPQLLADLFERFSGRTSLYYMSTLDPASLLKQLFFFRHLLYLREIGDHDTKPTAFFQLAGQYHQAYEVLMGSVFDVPGVAALFARTLFENGFFASHAAIRNPSDQPAIIRYLGYFPKREVMPLLQQKMIGELTQIFAPVTRLTMLTLSALFKSDKDIYFDRADEVYGGPLHVDKRDAKIGVPTAVSFEEDVTYNGKAVNVLSIETPGLDWRGQLAIILTVLSRIQDLDIISLGFENLRGMVPVTQVYVTQSNGRPLKQAKKESFQKELAHILDMKPITIIGKKASDGDGLAIEAENFVINPLTKLHARPSAQIIKLVQEYETSVKRAVLRMGNHPDVNLKSITAVMAAGITGGTAVTIVLEGLDREKLQELMRRLEAEVIGKELDQGGAELKIPLLVKPETLLGLAAELLEEKIAVPDVAPVGPVVEESEVKAAVATPKFEFEHQVNNALGLHARPASLMSKVAKRILGDGDPEKDAGVYKVFVEKDGESVDAKHIMKIMMLASERGAVLKFTVEAPQELAEAYYEALLSKEFEDAEERIFIPKTKLRASPSKQRSEVRQHILSPARARSETRGVSAEARTTNLVAAIARRIKSLKTNRPRQPGRFRIFSYQGFWNYSNLLRVLSRMWAEAKSTGFISPEDIGEALILAGFLRDEYERPKSVSEISPGLLKKFLGSLRVAETALERWKAARPYAPRTLKNVSEPRFRPKPLERDAVSYVKETGTRWLQALTETIGPYQTNKSGFYNVAKNEIASAVGAWIHQPLSSEKFAEAKKRLKTLRDWHKFERLPDGALIDHHPDPDSKTDGFGSALRREWFLLFEGLNFMAQAVDPLMPHSPAVAASPVEPQELRPVAPPVPQPKIVQLELFPSEEETRHPLENQMRAEILATINTIENLVFAGNFVQARALLDKLKGEHPGLLSETCLALLSEYLQPFDFPSDSGRWSIWQAGISAFNMARAQVKLAGSSDLYPARSEMRHPEKHPVFLDGFLDPDYVANTGGMSHKLFKYLLTSNGLHVVTEKEKIDVKTPPAVAVLRHSNSNTEHRIRELRALNPGVKIILVTGGMASFSSEELNTLGADILLYLPFKYRDELLDLIRSYIQSAEETPLRPWSAATLLSRYQLPWGVDAELLPTLDAIRAALMPPPEMKYSEDSEKRKRESFERREVFNRFQVPLILQTTFWEEISPYLKAQCEIFSKEPVRDEDPEWGGMSFILSDEREGAKPLETRPRLVAELDLRSTPPVLTAHYRYPPASGHLLANPRVHSQVMSKLGNFAKVWNAALIDQTNGQSGTRRSEIRTLELRGPTTSVKTNLLKVAARRNVFELVKKWLPEQDAFAVEKADAVLGIDSVPGIAFYMGGDEQKARLWIAMKLINAFKAQQRTEGRIDNPTLQQVIASLERFKVIGVNDPTVEVRGVHVALPLLTQAKLEALAEFAPVFLAFAVALNTKLYLNVQGAAPKGLEQKFLDAAARNGITTADGQFRILGVAGSEGSLFKSLQEPGVQQDALLAGEEGDLPGSDRATLWYNSDEARENMKVLASEITEALYAALDPRISKGKPRNIAAHFRELAAALATALQAFQSLKQSA